MRYIKWLIILMLPTISGCWSSYDVNDRIFVTAIFIDQGDTPEEIELTLLTPIPHRIPSSESGGGDPYESHTSITQTGYTIEDAVKRIESQLTRKLTWGQSRVIVIGHNFAKSGITPLLEWLTRQSEIRLRHQVYIAPQSVRKLIEVIPIYEPSPSEVLNQLNPREHTLNTLIIDFLNGSPPNQDTIASLISMKTDPNSGKNKNMRIGTDGAALFHNYRWVETLNTGETLAVAWAKEAINSLKLTYNLGSPESKITLQISNLKSSIRPYLQGEQITYRIQLHGHARILQSNKPIDFSQPAEIRRIEQMADEQIKRQLTQALKKSQKKQADILRLGSRLDWWYPKHWQKIREHWNKYYQNHITIQVDSQIKIHDFGNQQPSIHIQ